MKKVISPQNGRYLFDGGLNSKFEQSIIADNESPDCQNVEFANGAVGTRQGVTKLNTSAIGSFVGDGLYTRRTNTGGQTMVAFANGSAYTLAGTTFSVIASSVSVFTAGVRVASAQYQQHMFIGNGGVIPYKYNGTDFTRHGNYPPTETSTVSTGAAGALTGDYQYKVTWVNTQLVESNVGPVTATHTAAGTKISMVCIPVGPQSYGVNARRIYRTVAGGTTFKLLTTLSDNTTTTYLDNIADSSLGATAPTDNGVPPLYSVVCYHRDRIFCNDSANPNLIWYSNLNDPYTFGSTNFLRFGDNTTDIVRAIAVDGENLVVFGDYSIMMIYMPDTTASNWVRIRVKSAYGCKSPFGIVPYKNGLMFPAIQNNKFVGFAHLVGDAISPSATLLTVAAAGSNMLSDKIQPDMLDASTSDIGKLSGFVYNDTAYFTFASSTSSTENDVVYYFDFSISDASRKVPYAWAPWTGIYASQFTEYSGSVYYIDSRANGFVRKLNSGTYSDDGAAIDSYYWTKEFGGNKGDFNYFKDFRYANLLADRAGAYYMNVSYRVDSDSASGNTQTVYLDPGAPLWGSVIWGSDEWGAGYSQGEFIVDLGTASGKRIQFKFDNQNTVDQRFKVHSLNFQYNQKGLR